MATRAAQEQTIEIPSVMLGSYTFGIIGDTPFIAHRLSEKAQRELLYPTGRRITAAERTSLKHNPLQEYRDSPYTLAEAGAPTRLAILPNMFKQAMMTAALDIPNTRKTQIGRLVHPIGSRIPLFGVPQLMMSGVRSSDINHTPDIRTRAVVPEWACLLQVRWVTPLITEQAVINLLAAAGFSVGVGDWRPEKGAGTFGQFRICAVDDADFQRILKTGTREAQDAALENPTFYDADSEDLYRWFQAEAKRKGAAVA